MNRRRGGARLRDVYISPAKRELCAIGLRYFGLLFYLPREYSYYPSFSQPPPAAAATTAKIRSRTRSFRERTRANNTNSAHGRYKSHLAIYFFKHTYARPGRERGFRVGTGERACVYFPFSVLPFFFSTVPHRIRPKQHTGDPDPSRELVVLPVADKDT